MPGSLAFSVIHSSHESHSCESPPWFPLLRAWAHSCVPSADAFMHARCSVCPPCMPIIQRPRCDMSAFHEQACLLSHACISLFLPGAVAVAFLFPGAVLRSAAGCGAAAAGCALSFAEHLALPQCLCCGPCCGGCSPHDHQARCWPLLPLLLLVVVICSNHHVSPPPCALAADTLVRWINHTGFVIVRCQATVSVSCRKIVMPGLKNDFAPGTVPRDW